MSNEIQDPRLPAVERLAASRQRLRAALAEAADPRGEEGEERPSVLMTALLAIPGARLVVDAVRNWWSQHPLHLVTLVARNTVSGVVRPVVRRNPYGLVIAAMAIGGLLFLVKPWRGLLRPALLAGLLPHFVSRAVAQVPVEAWMASLMSMASERPNAAPAPQQGSTGGAQQPAVEPQSVPSDASHGAAAKPAPPLSSGSLH
jgi:hypothetical protein